MGLHANSSQRRHRYCQRQRVAAHARRPRSRALRARQATDRVSVLMALPNSAVACSAKSRRGSRAATKAAVLSSYIEPILGPLYGGAHCSISKDGHGIWLPMSNGRLMAIKLSATESHQRFGSFRSSASERVLITSPRASQPRRAWSMPKRMKGERTGGMGISGDGEFNAFFLRLFAMDVVQVEAFRPRIDLQTAAALALRRQYDRSRARRAPARRSDARSDVQGLTDTDCPLRE